MIQSGIEQPSSASVALLNRARPMLVRGVAAELGVSPPRLPFRLEEKQEAAKH